MTEDWPTTPEKKQEAIDSLFEVMALKDPELTIEAFKALVKADEANLRRRLLELKQREADERIRLQLIAFLESRSAKGSSQTIPGIAVDNCQAAIQ